MPRKQRREATRWAYYLCARGASVAIVILFPHGRTVILSGGLVTFLVNPRGEESLQQYLTVRAVSEDTPSLLESEAV